jgi:hypothetical protein
MSRYLLTLRVTVKDGERALLLRNGRYERALGPGRHRLLDPTRELKVETFQVVRAEFAAERYAVIRAERPEIATELFEAVETQADEIAIVSLDGRPTHLVGPWQVRVFWKVATAVDVERIDVKRDPKVDPRHLTLVDRARDPYVAETVVYGSAAHKGLNVSVEVSGKEVRVCRSQPSFPSRPLQERDKHRLSHFSDRRNRSLRSVSARWQEMPPTQDPQLRNYASQPLKKL